MSRPRGPTTDTPHLARGGAHYEALSSPLVMWLTAAAVLLSVGAVALIAVQFQGAVLAAGRF